MTPTSIAMEALDDLAFWVFGFPEIGGQLLMLRVVADESHDSDDAKVMTMAGFLAPKHIWSALQVAWYNVVHEIRFGGIPFHAADCANGAGDYEDWPLPKREELQ